MTTCGGRQLVGFGLRAGPHLTMGVLRRIPYLSYGLWPLFGLFDAVTLRRHYQPALFVQHQRQEGKILDWRPPFVVVAVLLLWDGSKDVPLAVVLDQENTGTTCRATLCKLCLLPGRAQARWQLSHLH